VSDKLPYLAENPLSKASQWSTSLTRWLIIVFAVAIIERVALLALYQPVSYSDTASYRRLAESVLRGFTRYDGTRTPGYPVFMALVGNDNRVWLVQLFLGLITTLLLFYIGWKLTEKPWFGGVVALAHTLNLGQLFFESDLLTETLTTFLLILTMAGGLYWMLNPKKHSLWLAFALGLTSALTLLVRPLFIYLPFWLLLFIALQIRPTSQPINLEEGQQTKEHAHPAFLRLIHWRVGIAFLVPVILLVGGWASFIYANYGDWSLTTMTGYHLMQHTGVFFEYVPDEYAALRDTYIKYRDAHIAQYGTQTNTIWEAIPEMTQVSGYNFYELSRVLTRISIQLILKHPILFLKNVIQGWWMFWLAPVYWSAEALRFPWLAMVINPAILIERALLFMTNLVFILTSLICALSEFLSALRHKPFLITFRPTDPARHTFLWFLLGNIWIASILQTLLDHGDNPRFLVPLQSLVILWVLIYLTQLIVIRRQKSGGRLPE
jgi:hypothetical protein